MVKRLSFSRLDTFQQCPRKYRLRYLDKRKALRADSLEFGTILHEVLEAVLTDLIAARCWGAVPGDVVEHHYREQWTKHGLTCRELWEEGERLLANWAARFGELQPGRVLAMEKPFRMQLAGYTMAGVIDRVDRIDDQTVRVIDYKTSRAWMLPDKSMQLAIYGTAARSLYGVERVQVAFDMLRHDQLVVCDLSPAMMDASAEWAHVLAEQLQQASEYAPRLNTFCHWCDYRAACTAYTDVIEQPLHVLGLADDADKLGDVTTTTKQRLAELQQMQRAQAMHGEGPKRPSVRRSRKIPAHKAAKVLERHGLTLPLDALSIDTKAAQKLTKTLDKSARAVVSAELEAQTITANQTVVR